MTGVWQQFLDIVREECGSRIVETWLKAITFINFDNEQCIVYLQAPNTFVSAWVRKHYVPIIQQHIGRLLHVTTPKVIFTDTVLESMDKKVPAVINNEVQILPARVSTRTEVRVAGARKCTNNYLNRKHIFQTFVVGPSNSLAYAAAHAVTERLGQLYNPLFIYGDSGLGKTHLLHAIGNEVCNTHKNATIVYQPADRFVSEFINAIRFDRVHKFKEKYQNIDLLLIDDIQFISNKEQTQEAFFHIFNALYESHKQIVCSSDTFPLEIKGVADRLLSRFVSGLVADIHIPSVETKVAILKKKAGVNGQELDDDVACFIASQVSSSVRELEGALIRIFAYASLHQELVTMELASRVLHRDLYTSDEVMSCERVARRLTTHLNCSLDDLRSKSRDKKIVQARQVVIFMMKKLTGKSLRSIGDFLGGRDHSTVLHALTRIEEQMSSSPSFRQYIQQLERLVQASRSSSSAASTSISL